MTPEQRKLLDELEPEHHLSLDPKRQVWRVYAYGTTHPFAANKLGGIETAKAVALAFRDSLPAEAFELKKPLLAQARSKAVGVSKQTKPNGELYWRAKWIELDPSDPLGQRTINKYKNFSIKKYGDKEAYNMAVKHRERVIFELGVVGGN